MFMKLKDLKKSYIYVTRDFPHYEMKRFKISLGKALFYLFGYSLFIFMLAVALFSFTPLRKTLFWIENGKIKEQAVRIKKLEAEVAYVTKELNKFIKLEKRLSYAVILAGADSLDSSAAIYDSLRAEPHGNRLDGGNLLYIINSLIEKLFQDSAKTSEQFYFIPPVKNGVVIRKFDVEHNHLGIDYAVKPNTPVLASASGYVIFAGFTAVDGNVIILQHKNNFRTVLKHCNVLLAKTGDRVFKGEIIAYSGNSGINTTGPHLHFEIWHGEDVLNPERFLIQ
jgi:murein DD-endopeptidase MepM/ murein hydrolase activator NlpD